MLKKLAIIIAMFAMNANALAQDEAHLLVVGEKVKVDVAGTETVTFELRAIRPATAIAQQPEAVIVEQFGDFECTIVSTKLVSSRPVHVPRLQSMVGETFLIEVEWAPGADYSGCNLEIKDPYLDDVVYEAQLFMNFG